MVRYFVVVLMLKFSPYEVIEPQVAVEQVETREACDLKAANKAEFLEHKSLKELGFDEIIVTCVEHEFTWVKKDDKKK